MRANLAEKLLEAIDPKDPLFHKLQELLNRATKHLAEVKQTEAVAISILKASQPPKDYKAQATTALNMLSKLNAPYDHLTSIVTRWHSSV